MKLTSLSSKAIFIAAALLLFASSFALAQTQEPAKPASEVDQLKQRLQQLEQTVTELKGQIEAIETKKKDSAPAIVEAKYSETVAPPPAETTPAEPAKPQDNGKGESTFAIYGFALPMWSMVAFLDHNWNKRFSTAAGYSFMDIDNSNGQSANAYHRGHYALTNLLFYPTDNVMIGGELQWGRRENFLDGFKSDDFRIQFSFKYNFSKTFTY